MLMLTTDDHPIYDNCLKELFFFIIFILFFVFRLTRSFFLSLSLLKNKFLILTTILTFSEINQYLIFFSITTFIFAFIVLACEENSKIIQNIIIFLNIIIKISIIAHHTHKLYKHIHLL